MKGLTEADFQPPSSQKETPPSSVSTGTEEAKIGGHETPLVVSIL